MRTDSPTMSVEATQKALSVIKKKFGTQYVYERVFASAKA
jgi:DNA topoisomerase IA